MNRKDLEKQKLVNLIIQGEAKNVKHIFHMQEVKDGLKEILGEREGERAYEILKNLTKAADQKDWLVPYNHTIDMMSGMNAAGLVSLNWE